ncbi:hypothetical protein D9615_004417 [Tricholomella constricta]|uniref:Uncharacterized protein n=1 Tax=Tricholomella constricta TaxID=117010 RepID=A0A8H5HER2_9AGAR|nr:hypothetical protein D9615_004417 [Tricholomella constricta]
MYDDEVIADSEDEGNGLVLPVPNAHALPQDKVPQAISQDIVLTAFDASKSKPSPISSISDPTTSSVSILKPRPKPRPLFKKDMLDATAFSNISPALKSTFSSDIYIDTELNTSSIAERAKIRSRNTKSQAQRSITSTSDFIELSSDDDDDFIIVPASKLRHKAADKPKAKSKATAKRKSISDEADTSDPRPRPRPRPLGKSKQGKSSDPASPHSGTISQETNPPSTSSIPIPFKLLPSQLPPSDPPPSTATTYDHPFIETLPQVYTDQELPSSPSSLFSIYSSGKKNRKRVLSDVDELDPSQGPGPGNRMDADTRRMPPPLFPGPPTFFAGSSSSSAEGSRPVSTDIESLSKKALATKKPRKKKVVESDEEDAAWGTSKSKTKSNAKKAPAKKVEVVIQRPNAKGKGKEKEKEVFKSREFIHDDDDDEDDLNAMDTDVMKTTTTSQKPESLTSLSSVPDSDLEETTRAGPSKKRKSVDRDDADAGAGGGRHQPETKRRATTEVKGKGTEKGKRKGTTAKLTPKPVTVIDHDMDDDDKYAEEEPEPPFTSSKENVQPATKSIPQTPTHPKPPSTPAEALFPSLSSRYTIAPKTKSTPMSDLIRRVNSKPGSPFCSPAPRGPGSSSTRPSTAGTAYSPYVKASRSALSRIAPLHPNRRTPPPPLPPPPPKRKTKKELEREEQWEEELIESVGGITEWACMSDMERKEMRRAKREREMAGWED